MADARAPIGVFDSGVGGLTVARELLRMLPAEHIVYLGDTARVPYGTKSPQTVVRYAQACARVLLERGIKLLVVACNTASAHALPALESQLDIPIVGVVLPGARAAAQAAGSGRIGVIATAGTIASGAYQTAIRRWQPDAEVFVQACPLFVPLAEEGWTEGEVPRAVARHYLEPMLEARPEALVLGCTHYPLLREVIAGVMGEGVQIIDSAESTAMSVRDTLARLGLENPGGEPGTQHYLVSDAPERFAQAGGRFLGMPPQGVEWIDF